MQFYTNLHPFYCGIDLHARMLYVCILDERGEILVHKKIKDSSEELLKLLSPYIGNIVVGAECMHCWYWLSDFCEHHNVDFILGHALYMKAIHGGKTKNDKIDAYKIAKLMRGGNFPLAYVYPKEKRAIRDLLRRRAHAVRHSAELKAFIKNSLSQYNLPVPEKSDLSYTTGRDAMRGYFPNPQVQRSIDMNLRLIEVYDHEVSSIECYVEKLTKHDNGRDYYLLRSLPGVGRVLALTILYEIGSIHRFDSVQKFASYSRLVKCKAESAGKAYGTQGTKIGNAHLKWAFSEAAVLFLKGNPSAQAYLLKLQKRMSKAKALSALAHKLGRCMYFMLKNQTVFDSERFLAG